MMGYRPKSRHRGKARHALGLMPVEERRRRRRRITSIDQLEHVIDQLEHPLLSLVVLFLIYAWTVTLVYNKCLQHFTEHPPGYLDIINNKVNNKKH